MKLTSERLTNANISQTMNNIIQDIRNIGMHFAMLEDINTDLAEEIIQNVSAIDNKKS
ncbi:hypothetical protein OCV51_09250 [Faecalicatena acetigenes]|uniref:Uncharacterized protein n=1 Tax=Faecalicatena acetigenes TaxID=2981790 RepID=A0ABT2TDQ6_9FIRM|nr:MULTISPECIES: hypothetical protein [Lachnospiraceae]MCU6747834.1 hypothetical protein [Faecalicatena acetigenes]SCI12318.1 Uncharacterised protein [uncultured Clostridium sp.]